MPLIQKSELSKIPRRSWLGWFLLSCFCVFQFSLQGSIGILAEGLRESLNLDAGTLSLLSSSFFYSYILMQIPVGFIFDRYGVRWIATLALLLVAASSCLFAMARSYELAVLARILMGFACSFGFLGLTVATGRWFPSRYFALLIAATETIGMVGLAGLNGLLSKLVSSYDWRIASWVCASIALFIAILMFAFAPRDSNSQEEKESGLALSESLRIVVSYKEVWFGGLFAFASFSIITVFAGLWAIPFLMASADLSLLKASSIVSMIYIGCAISSPFMGWLSGAAGRSSWMIMMGNMCLAGLLMLFILFGNKSLALLYSAMFCLGFVSSVYQIPFSLVNKVVPDYVKGVAMGVTNIICMLSGPVLQPIIGFFLASKQHPGEAFEHFPLASFQTALLLLPVCFFLSMFLAWKLKADRPPES